jgi:hemoglobin/transferrin/lactoferrin receptor protein
VLIYQQTGQVYIQKSQQGGGGSLIRGLTNRLLITVDGVYEYGHFSWWELAKCTSIDPLWDVLRLF